MVTVETKDVGDVKEKFRRECEYKEIPNDLCEKYIKRNMGLDKC